MQVLAFGDSFVKMFLHCRPIVRFFKFKGKSIKGIVKENDEQHAQVEQQIKRFPKVKKILFFFGQVDFNYVRYYKIINQEPSITEQTFRDYVKWIATLNKKKNIAIVSIFPSPVKEEHIIGSLTSKLSYHYEVHSPENDKKIIQQYQNSAETWYKWNGWIRKYCQIYNVQNIRLFDKYQVPQEFKDLSNLNIHLRYVPVLKRICRYIDIKFDEKKAQQIQKQYQADKVNRIQESINRIVQMREQQSETTTQQQQIGQNKGSSNQQPHADQSSSSLQDKSLGKIKSEEQKRIDLEDVQIKQDFIRPIRKKTAQVINTQYDHSSQQQQKPGKNRPNSSEKQTQKEDSQVNKKEQAQKQQSESEQQSEDEGEQFFNMAFGNRSKN